MSSEEGTSETADLRPHQQCPGETENDGYRFQTESRVSVLIEIGRLP